MISSIICVVQEFVITFVEVFIFSMISSVIDIYFHSQWSESTCEWFQFFYIQCEFYLMEGTMCSRKECILCCTEAEYFVGIYYFKVCDSALIVLYWLFCLIDLLMRVDFYNHQYDCVRIYLIFYVKNIYFLKICALVFGA